MTPATFADSVAPRVGLPPGPTEPPLVQALRLGKDPYGYLAECARRHGTMFTLRLPGDPPRVVVSEPALIRQIFALRPDQYSARGMSIVLNVGDGSMLFLDGERHQRERQLMMPHLHGERLRSYALTMARAADTAIDRLAAGTEVEIQPMLQDITLDVILRCVFGLEAPEEIERLRAPLLAWLNGVMAPTTFLAGMVFNGKRVRRFLDWTVALSAAGRGAALRRVLPWGRASTAKAEVMAALRSEVLRCREQGVAGRDDVLALLADARYEDGAPMEVGDVVDELVTLLVGGHETTANTLAWTLSHVLPRADVRAEIDAELRKVFGEGPVDPRRAGELVYLDACIKEAMRMTPIAPAVTRGLTQPLTLGDYTLPASAIVFPSVYLAQHRADLWPEPERYRPERFLSQTPSQSHFFPFGGGRRSCIGMQFAGMEMRIVLAQLFSRARLSFAPGTVVKGVFRGIVVAPADGLRVVVDAVRPAG